MALLLSSTLQLFVSEWCGQTPLCPVVLESLGTNGRVDAGSQVLHILPVSISPHLLESS